MEVRIGIVVIYLNIINDSYDKNNYYIVTNNAHTLVVMKGIIAAKKKETLRMEISKEKECVC